MELSAEAILEELNEFEKGEQEVTPVLNEYLQKIAKTGNILHPWNKLKPLLKRKMEQVLTDFCKSCPPDSIPSYPNTDKFEYDGLKNSILEAVDLFPNAPFTIQRLCELITNPRKHYNRTDKYMRGLEKNLLVVSTIGRNEQDNSTDRDLSASNDWANSDSSSEDHSYCDAANNVSVAAPAVNGTVLENFATVFPSATRIPNKANNIQVAIVTDTSAYQNLEPVDDLEYEVIENSDIEREMSSSEREAPKSEDQSSSEMKECEEFYNSGEGSSDSEKQEVSSVSSEGEECNEQKSDKEPVEPSKAAEEEESSDDLSSSEAEKATDEEATPCKEASDSETEMSVDKDVVSSTSEAAEKVEEKEPVTIVEEEIDSEGSEVIVKTETDMDSTSTADEGSAEPTAKRRKYEDSDKPDEAEAVSAESSSSVTAFLPGGDSNQASTPDISKPEQSDESSDDKPTSTIE